MPNGADEIHLIWIAFLGSLGAGMASAVGAAIIFAVRRLPEWLEDVLLSLAAGIMLAATFFSLLLPALESAEDRFAGRLPAVALVSFGLLSGAVLLWGLNRVLPHEHFQSGREGPQAARVRRIWLFVLAITIHNLPEGMAVGVGFATGDFGRGMSLAVGIGLQNVPEGLAVAASLVAIGYSRRTGFLVGLLSGLVEPVGGLIGAAAIRLAEPAMPWTLGLAAGAMLFVISDEIIPETHRRGTGTAATFALIGGFVLMMTLDFTLA